MIKFCSLYSGSSGNSLYFSDGKTSLLLDAGLSAKRIFQSLCSIGEDPEDLSAILISHEHSDHIKGAGIISRKLGIPVYANEATWMSMEKSLGKMKEENKVCFETGSAFSIGNIEINTFSIPHDASEPVGFNLFAGNKKVTVATDIGHIGPELLACFEGSDLLLLESNHDIEMLQVGPYPWYLKKRIAGENGHLSNEAAAEAIAHMAERGVCKFLLGHLSKENNFPELAYQTVCNALEERGVQVGTDVLLDVMSREHAGQVVAL